MRVIVFSFKINNFYVNSFSKKKKKVLFILVLEVIIEFWIIIT